MFVNFLYSKLNGNTLKYLEFSLASLTVYTRKYWAIFYESQKLLMYIINKIGPKILPWGHYY